MTGYQGDFELSPAGPGRDGFRVHIYADEGRVVLNFGIAVKAIPMPAAKANELAKNVFLCWRSIDPVSEIIVNVPDISVTPHGGEVLVEFAAEVDHVSLSPAESRWLCLELAQASGRLTKTAPIIEG